MELRTITKEQTREVIEECKDYASECGGEQEGKYLAELAECDTFEKLVDSGVFHDAVGKVVDEGEGCVSVAREY